MGKSGTDSRVINGPFFLFSWLGIWEYVPWCPNPISKSRQKLVMTMPQYSLCTRAEYKEGGIKRSIASSETGRMTHGGKRPWQVTLSFLLPPISHLPYFHSVGCDRCWKKQRVVGRSPSWPGSFLFVFYHAIA